MLAGDARTPGARPARGLGVRLGAGPHSGRPHPRPGRPGARPGLAARGGGRPRRSGRRPPRGPTRRRRSAGCGRACLARHRPRPPAMREAQVDPAIRRFAGHGLRDRLPDHASLARIRQKWGAERVRAVFERTARACVEVGIARGARSCTRTPRLIGADVAWQSLAVRHLEAIGEASSDEADPAAEERRRRSRQTGRLEKVRLADPDASMAPTGRTRRLEPGCQQHAVVGDARGFVLEVEVATGEANEGEPLPARALCRGRDDRRGDRDRDGRRRPRPTARAPRRPRAARDRGGDRGQEPAPRAPIRGRADPQPRSDAALAPRRPARRPEGPARQAPAAAARRDARPPLLPTGARRPALRPRRALPVEGAVQQGGGRRGPRPGARRAAKARPRPGTGSRAPCAAGSRARASRPSSPPRR